MVHLLKAQDIKVYLNECEKLCYAYEAYFNMLLGIIEKDGIKQCLVKKNYVYK